MLAADESVSADRGRPTINYIPSALFSEGLLLRHKQAFIVGTAMQTWGLRLGPDLYQCGNAVMGARGRTAWRAIKVQHVTDKYKPVEEKKKQEQEETSVWIINY